MELPKEEKELRIPVTTTIKESVYREIKAKEWKINNLIVEGFENRKGLNNVMKRLNEVEDIAKKQEAIAEHYKLDLWTSHVKIKELEQKLEELSKK